MGRVERSNETLQRFKRKQCAAPTNGKLPYPFKRHQRPENLPLSLGALTVKQRLKIRNDSGERGDFFSAYELSEKRRGGLADSASLACKSHVLHNSVLNIDPKIDRVSAERISDQLVTRGRNSGKIAAEEIGSRGFENYFLVEIFEHLIRFAKRAPDLGERDSSEARAKLP